MAKKGSTIEFIEPDVIEPDKRTGIYLLDIDSEGVCVTLYNSDLDQIRSISSVQFLLAREKGLTVDNNGAGVSIGSGNHFKYFIKKTLTKDTMLIAEIKDPSKEEVVTRYNQPSNKFVNGTNYRFLISNSEVGSESLYSAYYSSSESFKELIECGGPSLSEEITYIVMSGYSYDEAKAELYASVDLEFGGEEIFGEENTLEKLSTLSGSFMLEQVVDNRTVIPPTYDSLFGVNFLTVKETSIDELILPESVIGLNLVGTVVINKLDMSRCGIRTLKILNSRLNNAFIKELILPKTAISFYLKNSTYSSRGDITISILHVPKTLRSLIVRGEPHFDVILLEKGYSLNRKETSLEHGISTRLLFMEDDPQWKTAYSYLESIQDNIDYFLSLSTIIDEMSDTGVYEEPDWLLTRSAKNTLPPIQLNSLLVYRTKTDTALVPRRMMIKQKVECITSNGRIRI